MKHHFIHISDLHFRPSWPEQIGLVYEKFIDDVSTEITKYPNPYLVFSGDLVNAASEQNYYNEFMEKISMPLDAIGITRERRIVVPGNHDVCRDSIKKQVLILKGALNELNDEESFLKELPTLLNIGFSSKFKPYIEVESKFAALNCCTENIGGQGWELSSDLGLYCLNTSLCSFAGLDDPKTGEKISDKTMLGIDSRSMYQWEQQNKCKTKILVMHHPLDWLSGWARTEFENSISNRFSLIMFGHNHVGTSSLLSQGRKGCIFSMAPPLFTRKNESLGYSITTVDTENNTVEIAYRQWTGYQKFVTGTLLSGTDNGKKHFRLDSDCVERVTASGLSNDRETEAILEEEFYESSTCSSSKRQLWVHRDISCYPETSENRDHPQGLIDVHDLIANPQSCIIRAPQGFGLTALGAYLAIEYYRKHGKSNSLILCDCEELGNYPKSIQKYIDKRCASLKTSKSLVKGLIVDNWQNSASDLKLLKYLQVELPNIPIIILHSFDDFCDIQTFSSVSEIDGFQLLFLRSLDRARIRDLTRSFFEESRSNIDPDQVTAKLIEDVDALNMHRTPLNCLLLLKLLERAFDDSPVNRTEVIGKVLFALFHDFNEIPTYGTRPDLKDCERALGCVSEWLIRSQRHSFSKSEFTSKVSSYCSSQMIDIEVDVLFNFLATSNILVRRGIEFAFRHAYWLFYFTAQRMMHDPDFAKYILSDHRYAAFPEVVEFYTGLDRARQDAVTVITNDLKEMDQAFLVRSGIANDFNPFAHARWAPDEEAIDRMHHEMAESVRESSLSTEVKDAVADGSYDRSKPYHQEIAKFISNSTLTEMVQATKSAARALRNSDYVAPQLRADLLNAVITSWKRMCQTLALLSEVLSKSRRAEFDGIGFILADGFENEDDPRTIWRMVMTAIVDNVVEWYQLDLFSKKLAPLLNDYIQKNSGEIGQLLVLLLLVKQRPPTWEKIVDSFITSQHKNSFPLSKIYATLRSEFRYGFAPEFTRQQMRSLAAKAVAKHTIKVKNPNQKLLEKVAKNFDESFLDD